MSRLHNKKCTLLDCVSPFFSFTDKTQFFPLLKIDGTFQMFQDKISILVQMNFGLDMYFTFMHALLYLATFYGYIIIYLRLLTHCAGKQLSLFT